MDNCSVAGMAEVEPWNCQPQGHSLPQPGRGGGERPGLARDPWGLCSRAQGSVKGNKCPGQQKLVPFSGNLSRITPSRSVWCWGVGGAAKETAFGDLLGSWAWSQAHGRWFVSRLPAPAGSKAPSPKQQSVAVRLQGIAAFPRQTHGFPPSLRSRWGSLVHRAAGARGCWAPAADTARAPHGEPTPAALCKVSGDSQSFNSSGKWHQRGSWLRWRWVLSLWS